MPPKKRIKKDNQNDDKEKTELPQIKKKSGRNSTKKSVGRPRKKSVDSTLSPVTSRSNSKRKRLSTTTQSQIVFTHKEKKAFYECLIENGFSAVHNEKLLLERLPNRSINEIKSMIDSYSRRGQELNRKSEESFESETNSDKQPIEKWFDLIHQTIPNPSKKDDISAIFAQIFDELAEDYREELSKRPSSSSSSLMTPNYDQIYHYISETLKGKFPPELETIDAFIILKLIEELKELFKSDDYEKERQFLESGKWWQQNGVKANEHYYSAIHLQRQQENHDSVNTSVSQEESSGSNTQMNESDVRNSCARSSHSEVSTVGNDLEIVENGETSSASIEGSEAQNIDDLLVFPKLRKIVDCLNPIQVPIDLSKEEYYRWQK